MIIAEIGLNHLGSAKVLNEYLDIPDNVEGVTIQIISDDFYNNPEYTSLKLSDTVLLNFIDKLLISGKKVGLVIDDHTKINKFHPDKISFYKILSKDIENKKLINVVKDTGVESIYISTGMSDYHLLDNIIPSLVKSDDRIKLIHTQLSNSVADVNLKAIKVMRGRYGAPVAYGHHCEMVNVIYASLGFSPEAIFFYIKGIADLEYPDNVHAIKIGEVENMVCSINKIKQSIGDGEKVSMKNWA